MLKQLITIGVAAGVLLVAFSFSSNFYFLSLNHWELILLLSLLLFAAAGAAFVKFYTKANAAEQPKGFALETIDLSNREREVLQLLCLGKRNKEIGMALHISESTVKTHVSNLLEKFEVENRTQILHKVQVSSAGTLVLNNEIGTKV